MRKSNSQNNSSFIGHENIVKFLRTSVKNKVLVHAYLFLGPEQVGRRSLAHLFIYWLFCREQEQGPCFNCSSCRQIAKNIHPDIFFLKKSEDKKNISIKEIRGLQGKLSLGSFLNGYKVAVIEAAETLSIEAANALLKTLEEPAAKVILILIGNSAERLPATIVSRCQAIRFLPVPEKDIFDYLRKRGLSRKEAEDLTHLCFGRPGLAINFLEDKQALQFYQEQVREFINLKELDVKSRFSLAERLADKKLSGGASPIVEYLKIWRVVIRDLLLIKNGAGEFQSNRFAGEALAKTAAFYSKEKLLELYEELRKTEKYLKQNINAKLALENFFIKL